MWDCSVGPCPQVLYVCLSCLPKNRMADIKGKLKRKKKQTTYLPALCSGCAQISPIFLGPLSGSWQMPPEQTAIGSWWRAGSHKMCRPTVYWFTGQLIIDSQVYNSNKLCNFWRFFFISSQKYFNCCFYQVIPFYICI